MLDPHPDGIPAADLLRLAAHPLRWELLRQLARSDRQVHELTALPGRPQNLVSYPLGQLRSARLVSARRSSADARDAYYTADLDRLGGLLGPARPALPPRVRPPPGPPPPGPRRRIGGGAGVVLVPRQQLALPDRRGPDEKPVRRPHRGAQRREPAAAA